MHTSELTISAALRDPLIRQVLRADGISLPAFAAMLQQAASRQNEVVAQLESIPAVLLRSHADLAENEAY